MKLYAITKLISILLFLVSFGVPAAFAQKTLVLKFNTGDCLNCNSVVAHMVSLLPASDSILTIVVKESDKENFIKRYIDEYVDVKTYKLIRSNDFYNKLSQTFGTEICVWNETESKLLFGCEAKRLTEGNNLNQIKVYLSHTEQR